MLIVTTALHMHFFTRYLDGTEIWLGVCMRLKLNSHQGRQPLANQRLHLARDEVSDWLDAQRSTITALV
ncbi:hypothetical protein TNCV_2956931 [Trichonephila clavipes]|nr:hypothetical protein TNCV_2956931 [Trichonephila clavipes]